MIDVGTRVVRTSPPYRGVGVVAASGYHLSELEKGIVQADAFQVSWPDVNGAPGGVVAEPIASLAEATPDDESKWRYAQGLMGKPPPEPEVQFVRTNPSAFPIEELFRQPEGKGPDEMGRQLLRTAAQMFAKAQGPASPASLFRALVVPMLLHGLEADTFSPSELNTARVDAVIEVAVYAARAISKKEEDLANEESMHAEQPPEAPHP